MRRIIATILILQAFASIALAKDYFIYDLDGNSVPYEPGSPPEAKRRVGLPLTCKIVIVPTCPAV